ncbi:unnamed protein product [Symbiodinium sp. CCMP2592]|nr:unnamed protein product [Symbiodinium sp. CCMP2592]
MDPTSQRSLALSPAIADDERLQQSLEIFNGLSGGGKIKNRRRKGLAITTLNIFKQHLHTLETPQASDLLIVVCRRIAEIEEPGFLFGQSVPLLQDDPSDYADASGRDDDREELNAPDDDDLEELSAPGDDIHEEPNAPDADIEESNAPGAVVDVVDLLDEVPETPRPPARREAPEGGYLVVRPKKRPKPPQDLEGEDLRSAADHVLTLDWHGVADKSLEVTSRVFSSCASRPDILMAILSKTETQRFKEVTFRETDQMARARGITVLCLFTPRAVGKGGKLNALWAAINGSGASFRTITHVDDREDIVRDFDRFNAYGWRGIHMAARERRDLHQLLTDQGVL